MILATFTKVTWTPYTIWGIYFNAFIKGIYQDPAQNIEEFTAIGKPLRDRKYQVAGKDAMEEGGL